MHLGQQPLLTSPCAAPPARQFISLAEAPDAERFIDFLLPGIHQSGSPFVDWFFGDHAKARSALADWMRRPSSEAFVGRVTLCVANGVPVGGFVALSGTEVSSCRLADAMAAVKHAGPGERAAVAERLSGAQALFPEVPAEDFYISRVWVSPEARSDRHGLAIVRESLATGQRMGFTRVRADVCSSNRGVLRLCQFFKFETLRESYSDAAGMSYLSMIRIDD